jgi:hypothetical protein
MQPITQWAPDSSCIHHHPFSMPNIYPQRTSSPSGTESEAENIPPTSLTDADDSIFLSDLVRTGEASRLRRRGALRLDHGHTSHIAQQPRSSSPPVVVVGLPTRESFEDDTQGGLGLFRDRSLRYARSQPRSRRIAEDAEQKIYTLFCGGSVSDSDSDDTKVQPSSTAAPYEPSPLPLYPPITPTPTRSPRRQKKSNGCGALLHLNATPRQRQRTWAARGDASAAVVYVESYHFDKVSITKIERNSCGCLREGVACAVW